MNKFVDIGNDDTVVNRKHLKTQKKLLMELLLFEINVVKKKLMFQNF